MNGCINDVKVSVIIPVYNREKYIGECLDSILRQSLVEKEIICIDDGSTDNTLNIIHSYVNKNNNLILLQQQHQGAAAARNYGIDEAKGEYIAFMDSDDWYPTDDVLDCLYEHAKASGLQLVGGGLARISAIKGGSQVIYANPYIFFPEKKIKTFAKEQLINMFQTYIYKREFIVSNNIKFPDALAAEDAYFIFKAKLKARQYMHIPKIVYAYRISYKHDIITPDRVLQAAQVFVKIVKEAKENNLPKLQKQCYSRYEWQPLYRYVFLYKERFRDILQKFWQYSLFDKSTTHKMLLQESDINDIVINGEKYEADFVEDIKKYKHRIIYGNGGVTKFFLKYLRDALGVTVDFFCVTNGYLSQGRCYGIPVFELTDLMNKISPESTVFLITAHSFSHQNIVDNLKKYKCYNYRLIDFRRLQLYPKAIKIEFVWS